MKLIAVHSKATLEDFLRKCNEQISGNKNELALRACTPNLQSKSSYLWC